MPPHATFYRRAAALARRLCVPTPTPAPPPGPPASLLTAVATAPRRLPAVLDAAGTHTYGDLVDRAAALYPHVRPGAPVALFLPATADFIPPLLAAWARGVPAAPLSPMYPAAALAPLLETLAPSAVLTTRAMRHALPPTQVPVLAVDDDLPAAPMPRTDGLPDAPPSEDGSDRALIFFTSGTTGRPKGVVWTSEMLSYQLSTLSAAWQWGGTDHIIGALPLHHIHGVVNVALSALYNRATLELHTAFDPHSVWAAFLRDDPATRPTLFMGVPPMYRKLLAYRDAAPERDAHAISAAAQRARLFVCGSASLGRRDADAWRGLSGALPLERYGMTETGMTLSNPYEPEHRRAALLGAPLPGVDVRLDGEGDSSELLVRGAGVFREYYGRGEDTPSTEQLFTADGFFRTGDVVQRVAPEAEGQEESYRLLGRANADFVNTGGYKVSSVEIEEVIAEVGGVREAVVLGMDDDVLGQRIVAALVVEGDAHEVVKAVEAETYEKLPRYKVPRRFVVVDDMPRNVMGKVQKQVLRLRLNS